MEFKKGDAMVSTEGRKRMLVCVFVWKNLVSRDLGEERMRSCIRLFTMFEFLSSKFLGNVHVYSMHFGLKIHPFHRS